VLARVTDVHEAEIVTGDVVGPAKGDGNDQEEEVAPAPVRTVAHQTPKKRKPRKPAVVNAAATDEVGTAQNATASDNGIQTNRDEASETSPR
jgi:hypothetical protein